MNLSRKENLREIAFSRGRRRNSRMRENTLKLLQRRMMSWESRSLLQHSLTFSLDCHLEE